jgi:hypothetical protein
MKKKADLQGGVTDKKETNAGSGAFNQGSEQDPDYNKGTNVSDEEKRTGHNPDPGAEKTKGNPEDDNTTKNNP